MRPRTPFTKWLWDQRRSVLGWSLAVAAVGGTYAAFWPTIDDPEMQDAISNYPEGLLEAINYTDISTAAGYLDATVYGLLAAVLMIVYATGAGSRIVAGDEESGRLDLVLAHPVGRTRLALERFGAFLTSVVVIAVALLVVLLALSGPAGLDGVPVSGLVAMNLHLFLFASFFGAVAFSVGAVTGRRGAAIGVGSAVAVVGFAANGILPQVDGLEWVESWSPFDWLNGSNPLVEGVDVADLALMAVVGVVLVAAGLWGFSRRDIAV